MTDIAKTLSALPRAELAHLPTQIERLERLTATIGGPSIIVKRDDCTGLGMGGNKVRKLEFLLADAMAKGADTVVSGGVTQSNHIRQTAAACAKVGLGCHLAVMDGRVPKVDADYYETGNIFLDGLFGAKLEAIAWGADRNALLPGIADRLTREGKKPYIVPYGGSNVLGTMGYVQFVVELLRQLNDADLSIDAIVHASGSAGTQAGILAGVTALAPDLPVIGIDIDAEPERVHADVTRLYHETCDYLDITDRLPPERIEVAAGYAGDGYGLITDGMTEAVDLAGRLEGLLLDPVYSGKGFAGLIGLIRAGRFKPTDRVLFIHTGGTPALFAYRSAFAKRV